ncbi:putative methyltransferase TARBP1 [Eufriesea mexicana]|nr:putative methyltransferase TARBP1 [Eufriesea mexicana]
MCNNCFDNIWLQVIFERILLHENNIIVKEGILYVCKSVAFLFDAQFLKLFIHVLNNTFLYECQNYQQEPEILKDIITLFMHIRKEQVDFLNKVFQVMNEETWAPIPIFYMIRVLRIVSSKVSNQWKDDQLSLIKSLIQKSLNMHSHILRIASQIELLKIIVLSVKEINNFKSTINMLLEFPLEEIFIKNSFSWNIVIAWLKKVLVKEDVINFIKFMCEEHSCQNLYFRFNPEKFAVIVVMFHDANLILQQKACPAKEILNNWLLSLKGIEARPYANIADIFYMFLNQLLEESNNVPKLKNILLNEMKLLNIYCLRYLQESLLACLLHGHVLRKDKQIEHQVYLDITKNYDNCYPQHIQAIDHSNDINIRAASVVLLHKIINEDTEFASIFLPKILQKLDKYKHKRYFNHSYMHKIKHRIMQILLIIQPRLTKDDTVSLQEFLCNLILLETNQHSVRIMQEWILIKIFLENVEFHHKIWEFLEKGITMRPGCVSSIMCIVYHVSTLLPKDFQSTFILTGINYITHCCLGQQYSMRLYAQITFVKLYKILEKLNSDNITLQYKALYNASIANLKDGLLKNSSKIQDDFYLSTFHPILDYTLQTIYFELPRLTNMDASEWILPYFFKILNFKEINGHSLQLYNLNTSLSDTKTSSYLIKCSGDTEFKKDYNMGSEELNIQKKMNPLMDGFKLNLSQNDIFPTIRESILHKRILDEEGLIVVACLINRIPNLGGLARTCEIFNVKELVIANLNQIKDKEFQNLSVSAENWITITETKPYDLPKYLLNKKDMGWSLIGVEQTVNSINVLDMKFKKKTILVLGNEKNGIPANLIPLFNTCIEIPQVGVIRSLNVHVSGAICIWQYAKQHILM